MADKTNPPLGLQELTPRIRGLANAWHKAGMRFELTQPGGQLPIRRIGDTGKVEAAIDLLDVLLEPLATL